MVFDGFNNLLQQNVIKGTAPGPTFSVDPATNRLTTTTYDANGNDLGLGTYDRLNRLKTASGAYYDYDAGNKRVWKKNPAGSEEYYFYLGNQRLGTYTYASGAFSTSSTNTYFGGKMLTAQGSTVLTDRLGSNVTTGKRYFPWGQERPSATTNNTEKFTGYFRDAESGLDYADQRHHNPGTGRFITPDPAGDGSNWYAYAGGDPINNTDPTGLCSINGVELGQNPLCSITVTGSLDPLGTTTIGGGNIGQTPNPGGITQESIVCVAGGGCMSLSMACQDYGNDGGYGFGCGGGESGGGGASGSFVAPVPPDPTTTSTGTDNGAPSSSCLMCVAPQTVTYTFTLPGIGLITGTQATTTTGLGGGVQWGGAAELGAVFLGGGAQGSLALGGFYNPTQGTSGALLFNGGTTAYLGGNVAGAPNQSSQPYIYGAQAGYGLSGFLTNAGNSAQLSGPFTTYTGSIGLGVGLTGSLSQSGGIWVFTLGAGPQLGFAVSKTVTTTCVIIGTGGC
jgi:RHS repeat-associated protein